MKIGFKIFIISFTLVIITVNFIGISIINNNYEIEIDKEIERRVVDINNLMSLTIMNFNNISSITNNYYLNQVYVNIKKDNEIIYTNTKIDDEISNILFKSYNNENVNVYIKDKILYLGYVKNNFSIIISSNIKDIYNTRDENINYFIKLSLASSIIIAIILSIVVNLITRKLKKLSKVTKEMYNGNYNVEIPILGNDEIGEYANTFNEMRKSIKKNISEIEKVSENRKLFIGNLTHEIRTPLTSIIGYSSLIKNGKVKEKEQIKEYSEKIYEEGIYIENMRNKLMNLMMLENNEKKLSLINVSNEVNKYVKEFEILEPGIKINTLIKKDVYKLIDVDLFKSLVTNILKNSKKALTNKSEKKINIYLDDNEFIIEDNGKGISTLELKHIFEPFYTTDKSRNRSVSGMGLGLSLVLKIVEYFNFKIDIDSAQDSFTKVIIKWGDNHE